MICNSVGGTSAPGFGRGRFLRIRPWRLVNSARHRHRDDDKDARPREQTKSQTVKGKNAQAGGGCLRLIEMCHRSGICAEL
jgi:hypothetical protein